MGSLPKRVRDARACAQEIITSHVLGFDPATRDALISEYSVEFELELALSIYGFIRLHYVEAIPGLVPETGDWPFLWTIGQIVEGVAESSGADVEEVLYPILTGGLEEQPDLAPSEIAQFQQIQTAVRAAQATLAAHFLVRRGRNPIGIQEHLKLDDLQIVTRTLAMLGEALLVTAIERGASPQDLIRLLLEPVSQILHDLAETVNRPLEDLVAACWMELCAQETDAVC